MALEWHGMRNGKHRIQASRAQLPGGEISHECDLCKNTGGLVSLCDACISDTAFDRLQHDAGKDGAICHGVHQDVRE